ncbi:STAS domain-containing protein [Anaerosalibacter bizertensis]|uniref:Anti-sigma factor antagonist n=1 Tax=Anaerosalibacter bizertensis TaxID=932217 RepID=A0A844FJB3_9FIRM|nr:STAS domain-containing protein [Anaerosalibacter bizertensis]MBV1817257.1 STAS domain-containing protein [Bacteroidales bacterium MSK.15.36]HHV25613.1 STAS domain-containing protein [Tissierellia bacterium]MBU5294696.1 STAS domain-containing protein [Anaerosalibacter bizertensis]MCB5560136.1 STAS domain-containing protein [Anaerosalibacter bizertensis]MCG4565354.1 STAS domain-containing protein [Anaerosalibacter bizertensis]
MALNVNINYDNERNIWIVKPVGEVDIYTSPKLKEKLLKSLKEKETDLLIDGEKLDYIDSTGLGVLISILKKVKESENNIILINLKSNIRKLFDITGLDKVFIIKE